MAHKYLRRFINRVGAMLHGIDGYGFTECWHAYASDVVLEKSREHVFYEWLSKINSFPIA